MWIEWVGGTYFQTSLEENFVHYFFVLFSSCGSNLKRLLLVRFSELRCLNVEANLVCRKQLGGKLGTSLQSDLGVNTVGDLLQFSEEKLQECYGVNTGSLPLLFDIL